MDNKHKIIGKCPVCGDDVVKVMSGYACKNSFRTENPCAFALGNMIANRRMKDEEIAELLDKKRLLRDGFASKEGKAFTTILRIEQDGSVGIGNIIGKCPKCGGDVYANNRAFGCGNFKRTENPCNFTIWRNIFGHELTLDEVSEIIDNGCTSLEVECFDKSGSVSRHKIGLNEAKEVVRI